MLAKHCSGGIILGFAQFEATSGVIKRDTPHQVRLHKRMAFPTPWNQLEAGILFALGLPLLVFREAGVVGGVFDNGVTDLFIHDMPMGKTTTRNRRVLREVVRKWGSEVFRNYYGS